MVEAFLSEVQAVTGGAELAKQRPEVKGSSAA